MLDRSDRLNICNFRQKISSMANKFQPAYLKISGVNTKRLVWNNSDQESDAGDLEINAESLNDIINWIKYIL